MQVTMTGKTRGVSQNKCLLSWLPGLVLLCHLPHAVVVMVGSRLASFDTRTGDKEWTNEIADSDR